MPWQLIEMTWYGNDEHQLQDIDGLVQECSNSSANALE